MGTPLSKPKDVKEEIKKDLVSAGKPSTLADIDKIYDQEVKDFYKDFTGDLDFGKIAGSITGGKTLVTEIGTIT
jgi:hypothetical protein